MTAPSSPTARVGAHGLHVRSAGRGVTVLLESGGGLPGTQVWTPVIELLQDSARLLTYDRAGLGESAARTGPHTPREQLHDLDAVLTEHAPAGPVVLVGWSLGGLMVELYARQHPDRVVGLVLVDPTPVELFTSFRPGWRVLRTMLAAARVLTRVRRPQRMAGRTAAAARAELAALPAACRQLRDARRHGPAIAASTIVLSAQVRPSRWHRVLLRQAHAATAGEFSQGRFVVADGSSHNIPGERPDIVAHHVRGLLAISASRA